MSLGCSNFNKLVNIKGSVAFRGSAFSLSAVYDFTESIKVHNSH
jgi:hypothetical protein